MTKDLDPYIKNNATDIDEYLGERKIEKLADNALRLFLNGETVLEEIYPYLVACS